MSVAAATTACKKRAITGLTAISERGSALRRESSLVDSKRVKRSCHASSERSAWATASAARSPLTWTVHCEPKQSKVALCSSVAIMTGG